MLLLTTAAQPTLRRWRHPNLGRLCVPGCHARLQESLHEMPVAFDNGCFHGLDPRAVMSMYGRIVGWPSIAARLDRAWPGLVQRTEDGQGREAHIPVEPLPATHRNLLWCTVPDVVRCACGASTHCRPAEQTPRCAPVGDSHATRERWEFWMPWLAHLPLAYVLQDGAEKPGRVPWGHPSLAGVFVGGSDQWRYGPECAQLVARARREGLHVHFGRISSRRRIRYAASIGATSFDSSRYSRWRDITLPDGLAAASQPPQLRLVA
jgi:hypothetical protein